MPQKHKKRKAGIPTFRFLLFFKLEFRSEVELNVLEVHLSHLEHITTIRQEDIATFTVLRHVLVLTLLEGFEFFGIIALYPASLVEADRLPTALGIVFVLQTVLDNFELQLTYRTDNLTTIELVDEQLGYPFVHQLVDTLGELLLLHRRRYKNGDSGRCWQ